MPRPREFNPEEALQTAIDVFWEKGYHASSVDEVVKRSGVAKYGIYGTFGTKRELFLKVLERFALDRRQDIQRPIRKPGASLPEIRQFFKDAPRLATNNKRHRGCLITSIGLELGARDQEIGQFIRNFFKDIGSVLQACLQRAVNKGELDEATDIDSVSRYLATEFRTALMLAGSGQPRKDIEQHLDMALRVLP